MSSRLRLILAEEGLLSRTAAKLTDRQALKLDYEEALESHDKTPFKAVDEAQWPEDGEEWVVYGPFAHAYKTFGDERSAKRFADQMNRKFQAWAKGRWPEKPVSRYPTSWHNT